VSNVLSEAKKQQAIALGRLGWSLRRIERETGIRRETISAYLKEAGVELRPPRGRRLRAKPASPTVEVTTDSTPAEPASPQPVTTDSGAEPAGHTELGEQVDRVPSSSACETHRDAIETALAKGRNAKAIWQDLVDGYQFPGSYLSVRRFVAKLRGKRAPEARAVIETAPGEESQVDYGTGPMVRDPRSGKLRRTRLFVLTLGYSRKSVRLLTFQSSSQIWAELHEKAFRRLGGVTRTIILDNLREGVLSADIYDPTLNPLYADVLKHYGAIALPCRVGDPDRKGKVESGVGHAQKTPLKGQRFESLEEAQQYLDHWEQTWADTRIHGTTKRQVAAMFAEEKPALLPLPLEPFRYYHYGERTVHVDGCVEVEAAYYSAPPRWIGRRVQVQWNLQWVRLLDPANGQLLREHLREPRGRHRIHDDDRPQRTPLGTLQLLARAEKAGSHVGAFSKAMHREQGQPAVRRIQGLLSFQRKYGAARVDEACAMALEMEISDFRFVRRYLERNLQPALTLRQVDPLIRQLSLYRDLIQERTDSPHNQETNE
jgi:transposase